VTQRFHLRLLLIGPLLHDSSVIFPMVVPSLDLLRIWPVWNALI
jgi:hypothetical protein